MANDGVSLRVAAGEVLGVLGENGAGKSTLMNVLAGLVAPDEGEISLDGRTLRLRSPAEARAAGIGMVHQHFKLAGRLTVEENLALGTARGILRFGPVRSRLSALARELGIELDPGARVDSLSVGAQQQVEIVRALWDEPRVLILDEPTAVLAPDERGRLLELVRRLRAQGRAVLLISHKLEDVLGCCDRVVVMRQGRVVDESPVAGRSAADLVRLMVGEAPPPVEHRPAGGGRVLLRAEDLRVPREDGRRGVDGVSFELRAGEILGLCGVEGNGQSELVLALAGMLAPSGGRLAYFLGGTERAGPLDARTLRRLGLAHVPEDRLRHGVAASMRLAENWLLTGLDQARYRRAGWLRWGAVAQDLARAVERHAVRVPGLGARLEQLSGGNQQKLVLGRELGGEPGVLLAAQPTRGLDVRTVAEVQRTLLAARERGAGVLLLSSDLAELWEVADRVMVMVEGRLRGPVRLADTSLDEVGHWMSMRLAA